MPPAPKYEKVKIWLKEYLKDVGEFSGTYDELARIAKSTSYLIRKAIQALEKEGVVKVDARRGMGLTLRLADKEGGNMEERQTKISESSQSPQVRKESEDKLEKKKKKVSLQDQVLSSLLGKNIVIFLISGTRLEGVLLDFDNFTLSMTAPKGRSLVYKHAIATIIYGNEK